MVVGNAGALVLTLQAMLNNGGCATAALDGASHKFFAGLLLSFAGGLWTYLLWIACVVWLVTRMTASTFIAYADRQQREGYEVDPASDVGMAAAKAPLTLNDKRGGTVIMLGGVIAIAIYMAAGWQFVAGVYQPLPAIRACATVAGPPLRQAQNPSGTKPVKTDVKTSAHK